MTGYIIRRMLWLIPTLFVVAFVTFTLMHQAPGGPWDRDPGARQVDARTQAQLNKRFGLDKPLFFNTEPGKFILDSQFFNYIGGVLQGDLGPSYRRRGMDVQDILFSSPADQPFWTSRFGYSARLGLFALTLAIVVGVPLGIVSALRQNSVVDYLSLLFATVGASIPSFVLGLFLIIILAVNLKLVSITQTDWSNPTAWLLPGFVLSTGTMAFVTRLTRTSMLEVMRQDYVRTARAKGLAERVVIFKHMLKNALIPVVTILGPALAGLVTGSFIIELIFSFPGLGREYVTAIGNRDYSMIMGTTLFYAFLLALANLTVDIMYGFLDPRIRYSD